MRIFISLSALITFGIIGTVLAEPGDLNYRYIHTNVAHRDLAPSYTAADYNPAGAEFTSAVGITFSGGRLI